MKKIMCAAFALLMVLSLTISAMAVDPKADGSEQTFEAKNGEFYYGTPEIDGKHEALWDNVPKYYLTVHRGTEGRTYTQEQIDYINNLKPYFQGMWDENYLYIFMYINQAPQSDEFESNYAWTRNSLNFLINASGKKAGALEAGDFRAILHCDGNKNRAANDEEASWTEWKVERGEGYYQVEAKVDIKKAYDAFKLANGTEFGFDSTTNVNNDGSDSRLVALKWCTLTTQVATDTSEYGTIKLVDTKAGVTATTAATTTAATTTTTTTTTAAQTADAGVTLAIVVASMALAGACVVIASKKRVR